MGKIRRSIIVIGFMALAIGLGYGAAWAEDTAGPTFANVSVSPALVSAGTDVIVTADISDPSGINIVAVALYSGAGGYIRSEPWINPGDPTEYHLEQAVSTTTLADGTYILQVAAMDALFSWDPFTPNHISSANAEPFRVDSTPPVIENVALSDNFVRVVGTDVIVTADISDPSGINTVVVALYSGAGVFIGHPGPWINPGDPTEYHLEQAVSTTTLAEGTYILQVAAMDALFSWDPFTPNHISSANAEPFRIDYPPTVTITHPKDGDFAAAALNVAGNAWDTVDGPLPVEVSINRVVLTSDGNGDFGGQIVGPSSGEITITAKAIDSAGNVDSDSVTILRVHDNRKTQ